MAIADRLMASMGRLDEYIRLLSAAVDAKGDYFPGHSDGVAFIVRLMATEVDRPDQFTTQVIAAAMLHDVGKLMVPSHILAKDGPLTAEEWWIMKQHCRWGADLVERIDDVKECAPLVLAHHEHWNGGGYPYGLRGEAIPLESRMIHVADAFHVMTNLRPYRAPMTRDQALGEIYDLSGHQFCPRAVEMLLGSRRADPRTPVLDT